jgi:hypothetical protein
VASTTLPKTVASLGPFHATEGGVPGLPAGWHQGFDDRLRRPVWIRDVSPDAPALDAARLTVNRPTRLRWLAGRREPHEAWDVFEAVPGVPLDHACAQPRAWGDVRWWLLDLARECAAHTPDDTPPLRVDRVWVLESGGAKLVDDPTVDRAEHTAPGPQPSSAPLLLEIVGIARKGSNAPWPLGAQRFIDRLPAEPPPDNASIVGELESLTRQRPVLTRGWRALHVMGLTALPVLMSVGTPLMMVHVATVYRQIPPEVHVVSKGLQQLRRADRGRIALSPQDRETIEVALAGRYRHVLMDRRMYTQEYWFAGRVSAEQIERVLRRQATEAEGRRASEQAVFQAIVKDADDETLDLPPPLSMAVESLAIGLGIVAGLALVSGLAFRGGLMRAMGLELVTTNGQPASRLRVVGRTALAWAPLIVVAVLASERLGLGARIGGQIGITTIAALGLLIMLGGAIAAVLHPSRGIQDRLTGTWMVPR